MDKEEFQKKIGELSNKTYQGNWEQLSKDIRFQASQFRTADPEMTFIMQGLAVQIDRHLSHITKRQAEIDRAATIISNALPIEEEAKDNSEIIKETTK